MRVAAIITFYRHDAFFADTLASVLNQTRAADEIVVVDDASPPGTATTLERLDPRVRLIRHAHNQGVGASRQSGADATTAPLLAYLDGDDLWLPDKLEQQLTFLRAHSDLAAVHTALIEFCRDGAERVFRAKPARIELAQALRCHHVVPSSLLIRRDALREAGGWSQRHCITEDQDLVIRMVAAGQRIGFLDAPLVRFRRFNHGNLSSHRWWQMRANLNLVRAHRATFLRTLGLRETLAVCGSAIAGLGRDRGLRGRLGRAAGWLLGYRES